MRSLDILKKTLLRLLTLSPEDDVLSCAGEKWLWQKASLSDGPRVQSQALNARCEKLLAEKRRR